MNKVTSFLAVVALLSVSPIAFAADDTEQETGIVIIETAEADVGAVRRALWNTYKAEVSQAETVTSSSIDSLDFGEVEEIKSIYIVGRGIALTN